MLAVGFVASQGKLDEAGPLYKRCLDIDAEIYDPNHPKVTRTLNNLAGLLQEQVTYIGSLRNPHLCPIGAARSSG